MAALWAAVKLALDSALAYLVNENVRDPYMDEPFHVGQTQQYCAGRYHVWDPKITTFPGLYVFGTLWSTFLSKLGSATQSLGWGEPCDTRALRYLNVLLAAACVPVLVSILKQQHAVTSAQGSNVDRRALLWALALSSMPLHWFYTYLYYTDVGGVLMLLLCYHQAQRDRYLEAGLAGALAVLFRQTNAVWVAFVWGTVALRLAGVGAQDARAPARQQQAAQSAQTKKPGQRAPSHADTLAAELRQALGGLWHARGQLVQTWPLVLVMAAFVAFLVVNKGVAVGDREAHKPVRHAAQLAYFALFSAVMLGPALLSQLPARIADARRAPYGALLGLAAAVALCVAALRTAPSPHPYLLADNRHYTFYLWHRVLGRGSLAARWAGIGTAAGVCAALLAAAVRAQRPRLWVLGYVVCLAAVLVPAWLLEFRYYTIGFLLITLNIGLPDEKTSLLTLAMYALINAGTLAMFMYRPFIGPDGQTARFMW